MILDKKTVLALFFGLGCLLAACGHRNAPSPVVSAKPSGPGPLSVVVTTSTLASLVKSVSGSAVIVRNLVPIGASPETYEPKPQDLVALEHAAIVFENGQGLEGWLGKIVDKVTIRAARSTLSNGLAGLEVNKPAQNQPVNPHFWLDPLYAQVYVREIAQDLSGADPQNASLYGANAAAEIKRLAELDAWTRRRIATIPQDRRAMIAFHDAWYYFDRRYGIRDVGAVESSPGKEPSAAELAALIATAKANHVRAVFAEPEFSPKLAKQLADDAGIRTITNLYDDSLGSTPELGTYEGMMRHDVNAIVEALRS